MDGKNDIWSLNGQGVAGSINFHSWKFICSGYPCHKFSDINLQKSCDLFACVWSPKNIDIWGEDGEDTKTHLGNNKKV